MEIYCVLKGFTGERGSKGDVTRDILLIRTVIVTAAQSEFELAYYSYLHNHHHHYYYFVYRIL